MLQLIEYIFLFFLIFFTPIIIYFFYKKYKFASKIIIVNLLSIAVIICLFILIPIIFHKSHSNYRAFIAWYDVADYKWNLPNYQDYEWSEKNYREYRELKIEYKDYITWTYAQFDGDTINVDFDGNRETIMSENITNDQNYLFFGGSTMWGSGVSDEFTIPSVFSNDYKLNSKNFGQTGYIARQSLALLNNLYIEKKIIPNKNTIIFYDGVNEIQRCRKDNKGIATLRQNQIKKKLNKNPLEFQYIFEPFLKLIQEYKIDKGTADSTIYECALKPKRANEIANTLIETWRSANNLAKNNGDKFIAILQPVAFYGSPNLEHLTSIKNGYKDLRNQFDAVYTLIKEKINEINDFIILDFTHIYDSYDQNLFIYTDFCHVSPQGHFLFSKELMKHKSLIDL